LFLNDIEAIAVGIVEGEHRRHAVVPPQQLANVNPAFPHGGMLGRGVGDAERTPVSVDSCLSLAGMLRAIDVLAPAVHLDPPHGRADRGIESLLETEFADVEVEGVVLARYTPMPMVVYVGKCWSLP
jgi:hypothetical protein